jgi:hypothetical protein
MRAKGGRTPKRLPGVWRRVCELVHANPKVTTDAVWKSFPDEEEAGVSTLIYRSDGNDLVEIEEIDANTTRRRTITYNSLRDYLTEARKNLQQG